MTKAIVYASTTGNTEAMAQAIEKGAKSSGAAVIMKKADEASAADILKADVIILGSPAMGAEVLEDSMESFFASIEGSLSGKKVALFGSYDWGDGQWMRDWAARVKSAGGTMVNGEGLIAHLEPDADAIKACEDLGASA
ncbi:MAG: flavodoxin [Treponema socranskii subsp. buccale]|jgi:flavodoxin|uniref:flavodoxin n=1 Tax=Treponema socranskii TaxID=53419 RepID=UPI0020A2AE39|nr:flavodoxin [Treponema socranskii]UTD03585.1 flavodoxin [Treponema socranskii subsp. buccale]